MAGPVSSGYAGKPITISLIIVMLVVFGGVFHSSYIKRRHIGQKPDWRAVIIVGCMCAYLIGMGLWDIHLH